MPGRILFGLLCLVPFFLSAQTYEVLYAKKVTDAGGNKVKKGRKIATSERITVSEKGEIELDIESAMNLRLGPGSYCLKEEGARLTKWYNTHLKLTRRLKREGLITCKFRYKTIAVPGSDRHYEVDRIEIDQEPLVRLQSDSSSLSIAWHNPDYKYRGNYWVIVRDFFNHGFIDLIETDEPEITFFPGNYGHKYMYYTVLAENCRASLRHRIEIVGFQKDAFVDTNFTKTNK